MLDTLKRELTVPRGKKNYFGRDNQNDEMLLNISIFEETKDVIVNPSRNYTNNNKHP